MNEFEIRDQLKEERKDIKTFDDLVNYLQNVKEKYNCGYGEAPRAIAQAALATAWYLAGDFGITRFQAGFVMWDFIFGWTLTSNTCGAKLVDFDNLLYPQYYDKFDKTIRPDLWELVQKEAKKRLEERDEVHPAVKEHWESIVKGVVPFGFVVKEG